MAQKTGIPKGTRDFGPIEMERRNYIFSTITQVYQRYGFKQIETPAMENLTTLLGKYGEEGDKLLFKILNSGDFLSKIPQPSQDLDSVKMAPFIAEKGLRYDLTVPFARFVVQHQNELNFPFKRFQIQPVWRADRPQKGRYREFYQCDSDIIGSTSLLNEAELVHIIDDVFIALNIPVVIRINNRKILAGIAEKMGASDKLIELTVLLDKIDKIGITKVMEEVEALGLTNESLTLLTEVHKLSGLSIVEKLGSLERLIGTTTEGEKGIAELRELFDYLQEMEIENEIAIDLTLARGLNYYTGAIFEVVSKEVQMGSICGGGRYDDLTGIFGLNNMSGVGISFGADRIYDVLIEMDGFGSTTNQSTKVLLINFGKKESKIALKLAEILRKNGISTEVFPEDAKLKKQMNYADKNNIPYVIMAGADEIAKQVYQLKNMTTGEQFQLNQNDLITTLQ
ncbi:MAG: histidine--tRNA ligase [Bacteroidales bacterium]|nr:histidine--tRNA ligase [Bacteroidales bacterium]